MRSNEKRERGVCQDHWNARTTQYDSGWVLYFSVRPFSVEYETTRAGGLDGCAMVLEPRTCLCTLYPKLYSGRLRAHP